MPWQKGQSGNPAGRPKGSLSAVEALRAALERPWRSGEAGGGRTQLDRVARALVEQAAKGNVQAAAMVFERIDGKVAQRVEQSIEGAVAVVPWLPATVARGADGRLALVRGDQEDEVGLPVVDRAASVGEVSPLSVDVVTEEDGGSAGSGGGAHQEG
jgi:hypothetical protein